MIPQLRAFLSSSSDVFSLSIAVACSGLALLALLVVLKKRESLEINVMGHRVLIVRRGVATRRVQRVKEKTRQDAASDTQKTDNHT